MDHALTVYNIAILAVFLIGYVFIIFEHVIGINKATSALLMAVTCWSLLYADRSMSQVRHADLNHHLAEVSQVIIFLLSAMTIVETISAHGGLHFISKYLITHSKSYFAWLIGIISFFLSSVLDNLTTTIVMVSIIRKLVTKQEDKWTFGSIVVLAANAGGVWTPIGDVTTTMLWVGGQLTAGKIVQSLFLPSIACFIATTFWFTCTMDGPLQLIDTQQNTKMAPGGKRVFFLGVGSLIFVPIFQAITGLPPFMSILFSLGIMWIATELFHRAHTDREHLRIISILSRIDMSAIFFFLGILLGVSALQTAGILEMLAQALNDAIAWKEMIAIIIGIVSAIVDNVPLVAGCMGMYSTQVFPQDSIFWQLIAFCAGTGGSLLIIGSAAGVAFMSLEKVDFFWYLKRASIGALIGYIVGIITFLLLA